jgi:hypothetical protein
MLGPDVPAAVLGEITYEHRPAIVAFTLTMVSCLPNLVRAVKAVASASPATSLIVGGQAASSRFPEPEGLTVTPTVVDVVEVADALVHRPQLN